MVVTLLACLGIGRYGYPAVQIQARPRSGCARSGRAVADALAELGEIEEPQHCRVEVESAQGALISRGAQRRDHAGQDDLCSLYGRDLGALSIIPGICW